MKTIIYIIGAGRSGTTLLDIILGNNDNFFSCGELNRFPDRNGIPPNTEPLSEKYLFWKKFREALEKELPFDFEYYQRITRKIEYHKGFFSMLFPLNKSERKKYKDYINIFYKTLTTLIQEKYIIDSSKYPLRGFYLAKFLDLEIKFIYIKRNPVDVINSFQNKSIEQPSKNKIKAIGYITFINLLCIFILKKISKKHQFVSIFYDDLVKNPETVITDISKKLDLNLSKSIKLIIESKAFIPGHLFDGNRIRNSEKIFLTKISKTDRAYSLSEKLILMLNSFWWQRGRK